MELGKKLLLARQEAGLSQRQLCGDIITRNMLSQIEHGTARPSMDTLRQLASRLGKPVSYFLEEDALLSPNQALMDQARKLYHAGEPAQALERLSAFRQPDPVLEWEWRHLTAAAILAAAQAALDQEKYHYARQLLENMESGIQDRERLLLLGKLPDANLPRIAGQLPSLDEELLLRAEAALQAQDPVRAECLLLAAETQQAPRWHLLRGRSLLMQQQYRAAAEHLELAEAAFPGLCWPLLESCFRELGDFQRAYFYACKQRQPAIF